MVKVRVRIITIVQPVFWLLGSGLVIQVRVRIITIVQPVWLLG